MAKRKKKNKGLNKVLSLLPLVLGVVVIALMLLDAVKYTGKILNTETSFSGFNVMFGLTEKAEVFGATVKTEVLGFSILATLAVLLPIIGAVVQTSNKKLVKLIGFVSALGGAILIFVMPSLVVFASEALSAVYANLNASLAIGGIIAGIVASIEAFVIGYTILYRE